MPSLFLVSTPIGNLGDLSPRAADTLSSVARVLAEDTRHTRKLLTHMGLSTTLVSLHSHNEASRLDQVLGWLAQGEDLALVSDAGTPLVSDPGQRLVEAVLQAGFTVVPIPGPSAVLAALVGSGFPMDRFSFLGFLPRKGSERGEVVERVLDSPDPVVLFESPERVVALLDTLIQEGSEERRVSVGRELTKLHEEFVRGSLAEVKAHFTETRPRGEFVVVVAGAGPESPSGEVDQEAARALAQAVLSEGVPPSRAAKEVARRLKLPRNLAYGIVQEVSRNLSDIPDHPAEDS